MKNEFRALQLWSILALAARNRQTLTYKMVSRATGLHLPAVGGALFPIQYYCNEKRLPKLTILVVKEKTGLPGKGLPLRPSEFPSALQKVFSHDWLVRAPKEDEIRQFMGKNARR